MCLAAFRVGYVGRRDFSEGRRSGVTAVLESAIVWSPVLWEQDPVVLVYLSHWVFGLLVSCPQLSGGALKVALRPCWYLLGTWDGGSQMFSRGGQFLMFL